jgi:hypothetical protein
MDTTCISEINLKRRKKLDNDGVSTRIWYQQQVAIKNKEIPEVIINELKIVKKNKYKKLVKKCLCGYKCSSGNYADHMKSKLHEIIMKLKVCDEGYTSRSSVHCPNCNYYCGIRYLSRHYTNCVIKNSSAIKIKKSQQVLTKLDEKEFIFGGLDDLLVFSGGTSQIKKPVFKEARYEFDTMAASTSNLPIFNADNYVNNYSTTELFIN